MDPGQVGLQFFIHLFCEHVHTHAHPYTHVLTDTHSHKNTYKPKCTQESQETIYRSQFSPPTM